jgi:hypothetical protein
MYLTKMREISFKNKYTNWYLNICYRAQQRASNRKNASAILGYAELHHILPKSFKLGGEKDPSNYAYLSIEEHFVCHRLLTKMFSGKYQAKMNYAMTCFYRKSLNRKLSNKQYAIAVKFYRKKFDEDRCHAISQSRRLTPKKKCPHCNKDVDPGNFALSHGDNCKMNPDIDKQILIARRKKCQKSTRKAIEVGTHKHRSPNSYGLLSCPYCPKTGNNLPNMKKNHFDNCKSNPNSLFFGKKRPPTTRKLSCINCHKEIDSGNFAKSHGINCRYPKFSDTLPQT